MIYLRLACWYGLNISVPLKLYVEVLIPKVMVCGG